MNRGEKEGQFKIKRKIQVMEENLERIDELLERVKEEQ